MANIIADKKDLNATAEAIDNFFRDLRNFREIMPDQIQNWQADKESCSFSVQNLGKLGMKKGVFNTPHQFEFVSNEASKVNFTLVFHFSPDASSRGAGYFEILADMNPVIEMMAKRPLLNFVNILTENLAQKMR